MGVTGDCGGGGDAAFLQPCPPTLPSPQTPLPQPPAAAILTLAILILASGVTAARGQVFEDTHWREGDAR